MAVAFSYPADLDVTLDAIDWQTEWYTGDGGAAVVLGKDEHIREEDAQGNVTYYAIVPTGTMTAGRLWMRMKAEIPVEDGYRTEYAETGTEVYLV